jgi:uncharacterized protein YjbI with pentapeptide repeats
MAVGYIIGPGADLTGINLTGVDLTGVDLSGADLTGANLTGADLTGVPLNSANLTGVDLYGANLTGANLSGAGLTGLISGNITGTPTLPTNYALENGYIIGPYVNLSADDLTDALGGVNSVVAARDNALAAQAIAETARDNALADKATAEAAQANAETNAANAETLRILADAAKLEAQALVANLEYEKQVAVDALAQILEVENAATQLTQEKEALLSQLENEYTLEEIEDLRAGSTTIQVTGGQATLNMFLEKSSDLDSWTPADSTSVTIQVDPDNTQTQFFRFRMD